jgi:hypothetical protein
LISGSGQNTWIWILVNKLIELVGILQNVYSLPKKQLRHDLKMWGFEKTLSKELARDIVKARKIALRCNKSRSGVSMVLERVFERYSEDSYGSHTFSII